MSELLKFFLVPAAIDTPLCETDSVEDDISCNPYKLQESRDRVWGPGAQYWVSYLQCTLCIVQRLPLLQVHSKINSNFSVILVSGEDQVR